MANDNNRVNGGRAVSEGMADILRTSCRLMAQRGFHGTSMRDLAQATGRSISGLYHHFRGKEDLLFLINYHGFKTLNDRITERRLERIVIDANEIRQLLSVGENLIFHNRTRNRNGRVPTSPS